MYFVPSNFQTWLRACAVVYKINAYFRNGEVKRGTILVFARSKSNRRFSTKADLFPDPRPGGLIPITQCFLLSPTPCTLWCKSICLRRFRIVIPSSSRRSCCLLQTNFPKLALLHQKSEYRTKL